jgi:ribosome maturation factor RimP
LLAPVVADAGFELEDLSVTRVGRRTVVRLVVDADSRPDLDAIANVSRLASDRLDSGSVDQLLGEDYLLEVSSPGVDRPLIQRRHWSRSVGRLVSVAIDGAQITGRILSVDDDGVEFDIDGRTVKAGWPALVPGKVQVEFNRPASTSTGRPALAVVPDGG